jgi:hypothetical protein
MPSSKLSDQDVFDITSSDEPAKALAERFCVSSQTVYRTRRGTRNQNRAQPLKRGRPRTRFSKLCGCDCGALTSPGRDYRAGHSSRLIRAHEGVLQSTPPVVRNRNPRERVIAPGARFGRLTVLEPVEGHAKAGRKYRCRCDCGGESMPMGYRLRNEHTRSCGCLQRERASEANLVHGASHGGQNHRTYRTWKNMRNRCNNPNSPDFRWWGARGIKVCDEWGGPDGFPRFRDHVLALPHRGEPGRSLDRIDNDGDYEPWNVRWGTHVEQARNRRPCRRGRDGG